MLQATSSFSKISSTFLELKDEIKKDFDKGGLRTKRLRKDSTAAEGLVAEKLQHISDEESSQHFSTRNGGAAKSLKFPAIQPGSCIPSRFPTTCTSLYGQGIPVAPVVDFRFLVSPPAPSKFLTSTPKRHGGHTVSSCKQSEPSTGVAADTSVKLTIEYPSKSFNKTLGKDYEAIGKALAYGPPQRVATAVVKCKVLTEYVVENILKILANEVNGLCSRRNPSLMRKCGKDDLVNFDFQSLCDEWKERAPLFFSFLMTCCVPTCKRDVKWLPSAAVARSVLLKQCNSQMNATASVLGVLIKTGSMEVCRFSSFCRKTALFLIIYICLRSWGGMGDLICVRILFANW